jgi:peptide/nickel transport system permease protein
MKHYTLLHALASNRLSLVGLILLGTLALVALLAPWLAPADTGATFAPLLAPAAGHPLGTNDLGYDLWGEFLHGARFSLFLGATAALASAAIGLLLGVVAGYFQRVGFWLMRLVDVLLCVPRFPLIVLMAAFARPGLTTLLIFFILFGWPSVARIIYARTRAEKQSEYIAAVLAIGARDSRVLFRHLLPATLPVAFVRLVAEMQHVIMAEAGLSFLGLGDPTMRSWGMTLSHASRYPALLLTDAWQWWVLPPGLAITAVCVSLTFIGLALDPLANPRLRQD